MRRTLATLIAIAISSAACATFTSAESASERIPIDPASTTSSTTSTLAVPELPVTTTTAATTTTVPAPLVRIGAQVLADDNFAALTGSRVGLIAHQNSVVTVNGVETHLTDAMSNADDVALVALFGPEHGVRGTADAGELINDEVDPETGIPVFSLFGSSRKPTAEMLAGIDTLVYDLQDVGTRYYTYISTMGLAMQAAAQAQIRFVVLDRPNPLGGEIGGGVLEVERTSFVGQYPIPDQYGLTAGELAQEIVENAWLPGLETLQLDIVPVDGWSRDMRWPETGLDWIAPSPALDTAEAALLYPATIWFEASSLSYGRGTSEPFRVLGAPWLDAQDAVVELTSRDIPGVRFESDVITPALLPNMTVEPAFLGQSIPAIRLRVTDPSELRPTTLGIHLLDVINTQAQSADVAMLDRPGWLDQLSGNNLLRRAIESGDIDVAALTDDHSNGHSLFANTVRDDLLYD